MNNVERAAEVIDDELSKDPEVYDALFGDEHVAISYKLRDAGLLMPMQIVRTAEELEALDAGTYLVDVCGEVMTAEDFIGTCDFPMDDTDILAVVATEDHIRAARKALGATDE